MPFHTVHERYFKSGLETFSVASPALKTFPNLSLMFLMQVFYVVVKEGKIATVQVNSMLISVLFLKFMFMQLCAK